LIHKDFSDIFTKESLKNSFFEVETKSTGIDNISIESFKKDLDKNLDKLLNDLLSGVYIPEPVKKIEIEKNKNEVREIGLSSIKDKIIQKCLNNELSIYFDKNFSDKSYAYRPNKNTLKAINRCTNFINHKNHWVLKTDIDNFFDNISHDKLLDILNNHIQDKKIIRLISLFLQNGGFKKYQYLENLEGIHQGETLSPLLSNIYLDLMDKFLEQENINFVRFGDDFTIFCKEKNQCEQINIKLIEFLKKINLSLNSEKTNINHINNGFTFLGIRFQGFEKKIDNERFQKSISKIHSYSKQTSNFNEFIEKINMYMSVLRKYYLKIIDNKSKQFELLKQSIYESISKKVFFSKSTKEIETKYRFRELIEKIDFISILDISERNNIIDSIINKGFEEYQSKLSIKAPKSKINEKVNSYSKKFSNESTIHISEFGLFLGISKNKFVVKKYGKVLKAVPENLVQRIVIDSKGVTIGTDLIEKCADKSINIDFIDKDSNPYASIISYKSSLAQNTHKQLELINTQRQLDLALAFIKGKAKNQINYIKYLDKYHNKMKEDIKTMESLLKILETSYKSSEQIMGYEGQISSVYWNCIKKILLESINFEKRVHQGARDIFNCCLNYGYAILYGKVQSYLLKAGLSLHVSFLHSMNETKPTLVFDFIEEFRSFVVDRTIVSMINKKERIKLDDKGLLTKTSRQLIAKNIYEKFGTYTIWRKERRRVEDIIEIQAYNLARSIDKGDKYKPFIGKY
jgi:group II intron reverse transcriptase/maturase/CRISPR-associated endonuclease Cas1